MREFELIPIDGRKSFYGKAVVIEKDNGDVDLKSYYTVVCGIRNGRFVRFWGNYSSTTMRHIKAFCDAYSIECGGKQWWNLLEISDAA